ncbi:MAG: deoxyribose-phosphate aldolase [Bacteroidetes bacterium]|nr:MAG: deoxyribose-phosphate aldolase [Bacteroidota bacterium]
MHSFSNYDTTQQELTVRAQNIIAKGKINLDKKQALKQVLGFIDLTTLSGDDTTQKVTELCAKAESFFDGDKGIPNVAAVCVYPVFANTVHHALKGTDIKTACVAGAFPSGQSPLPVRIDEVKYAVDHGADEIDMVISRGRLLEGDMDFVFDEVRLIKEACGEAHLKVILETGELKTPELIRKASVIAINAGAEFIKTSTGKITPAATHEAFLIMLDTIKEYYEATGEMIGIKPAGGISTPEEALSYYLLVKHILGERWLSSVHFRIGASSLADKVYDEIIHL